MLMLIHRSLCLVLSMSSAGDSLSHLTMIFFLGLPLHIFTFIFSVVMVFSSPPLLTICPVNDGCRFLMDLIQFLSTSAFDRHHLFIILAIHGNLNILLMSHISVAFSDLTIYLLTVMTHFCRVG